MKKIILVLFILVFNLNAKNYRLENPDAWSAKNVESAIESIYGKIEPIEGKIKLKAPKVASNGSSIPIFIKTSIKAKSIAIFQDANPESTVAIFNIQKDQIIDLSIKIKMKKSGNIYVLLEGLDGKFYSKEIYLDVAIGGCEG